MRVLIVIPSQDTASGNWVTARRFATGLEQLGHTVALHGTTLQPEGGLARAVEAFAPDVALLLHAYRAGRPWLDEAAGSAIPGVILLTGTDVNHGLGDPAQREVIRAVLQNAAVVLVQNPLLETALRAGHPDLAANLRLLPAGITLGTTPYDLRARHNIPNDSAVFLCPAGLRPVKGLSELLEMSGPVAEANPAFLLAFCGPPMDEAYAQSLLSAIEARPWARYLGAISPGAMASAMHGADVVLNNSHSEGLANALLEAASLGIPILARRIPGNAAVVDHGRNGLLFETAAEYRRHALQLCDPAERSGLSRPDPGRYDPRREALALAETLAAAAAQLR